MRIDSPLMTNAIATGSFSGSFTGTFEGDIQADSVAFANVSNKPTLVSGSIQIDHDAATNFVANEHIDHSTITIGSGQGLSGGGTIVTSRSITLDTGSAHFTEGIKLKLDTDNVISGSAQVDYASIQNQPTTISGAQASAITANTAKTGITSGQASAITANTAKTGISSQQASDITANNAKISYNSTASTKLATIETGAEVNVVDSVAGKTGVVTLVKGDVGLANVDNTADSAKPVSTAGQTALNLKADLASPTFTGTVAGVTATHVGLGNVTNTSDANKPVSTAQQTALNLKANLASPTFTGTPLSTTPASNDSSTKIATTAYVQGEITDLIGGAGAAFDTLLEISASIANGDSDVVSLTAVVGGKLTKADNLSDLTNAGTARTNLGLGSLATLSTVNAATITDNSVGAAELNVTGNGTATQFLRSDGDGTFTWAVPTDTNTTYSVGDGGLTEINFTTADNTKLDGIEAGADVNTVTSVASKTGAVSLVKGDVGLGNVTNESKATMFASPTFTGTVGGVTKGHVGLGSVDNTADSAKPVSTAQATAIGLKANLASPTFTGTIAIPNIANLETAVAANTAKTSNIVQTTVSGNAGTVTNGVYTTGTQTIGGAKSFSAAVNIDSTTASTSKTTGALIVDGGVGIAGAVNVGGDVVAYASSDKRLKDNIQVIPNALMKIEQIGGYEFDWNNNQDTFEGHDIGVIAQEIEAIAPELVSTRDNGYKAVKYDKLTAILIEAVKELSAKVRELENK